MQSCFRVTQIGNFWKITNHSKENIPCGHTWTQCSGHCCHYLWLVVLLYGDKQVWGDFRSEFCRRRRKGQKDANFILATLCIFLVKFSGFCTSVSECRFLALYFSLEMISSQRASKIEDTERGYGQPLLFFLVENLTWSIETSKKSCQEWAIQDHSI